MSVFMRQITTCGSRLDSKESNFLGYRKRQGTKMIFVLNSVFVSPSYAA